MPEPAPRSRLARVLLLAVAGNSIAHYRGWGGPKLDPAMLSAKIAPYYRAMKPPGPLGPPKR